MKEITVKVFWRGTEVDMKATLKAAEKKIEDTRVRNEVIPQAINALLSQYPNLRTLNLKAIVGRVAIKDKTKVQAWAREYIQDNSDQYDLNGSVVWIMRNLSEDERKSIYNRREKEAQEKALSDAAQ